ncbi:hypothetical protein C8F04DRAFT_1270230 [Mycena alexandri]|uniref:Uncharacterized protein n=1 Tax=Mycena alexandri TaxID=1745969 RepID=A0AAD6SD83_9AGAR|nr:hypothetical protein C8F04DRAFT_1270230 [Mycena alexandri]
MDPFYDLDAAAIALEQLSIERRERSKQFKDALPHLADIEAGSYSVVESGAARKNWKLCIQEEDEEVATEIVFTLQGVLSKANLVPKQIRDCRPNNIIKLSQYAELSGLGTKLFEDGMANTSIIHDNFAQHFGGGTPVFPWIPATGPTGTIFSANNRLFTLKIDSPTEQSTEFEPGVDPVGMLERLKTRDLFHGPENIVKYFKMSVDDDSGEIKYLPTVPGTFKVGDLVEMQGSFVAIMTTQNQIKVTTRLHALTALDNSLTKAADKGRAAFQAKVVLNQKQVRRKIGYFYEDSEEGQASKKQHTGDDKRMQYH